MKHCPAYFLLLPLLAGCYAEPVSTENRDPVTIGARAEQMPGQDDSPMEDMPDDDQGIIHF
jgi:hypothetical protein